MTALFRNLRVFDDWRGSCDHPTLRKADPNALTLWEAEYRGHFILAPLIRMILESPIYRWMAAISALDEIAIPLSHTMFRRVHDNAANDWWGLHQDHSAVNPDVPFNVWLPLEPCSPDQRPTLGFWAGIVPDTPKRRALDARCSARPDRIWLPSYASGDVALFTNRTPHMTTGFNTGALRWSAELRYMDPRKIPEKMAAEPFLIVTRGDRGFDLSRMTFRNLPEPVLQYMTSTECRLPIL